MVTEVVRIRPFRPGDLDELYRVCLLTADNGEDATPLFSDPQLPGHVYAAPYGLFEPALVFVAEDPAGVGGYIVGARDSQDFARRLERDWWPGLRDRYPRPPGGAAEQELSKEQRVIAHIHHPWGTPGELAAQYPSHLHINLVPRLQGHGAGRRLIDTFTAALRNQNSPGVHLHVSPDNTRAAGFYRHVGFADLAARGQPFTFVMDLRPAQ